MGRIRGAAALGLLVLLAGCSSETSGQGSGQAATGSTGAFPTDAVSSTASGPAGPSATASTGGGGGNGGGNGGGGGGSTKTATPTRSATTVPTGLPSISSYQATAGPTCGGTTGTSQVTLTWRTANATEVWIQISQVAFETGDPKVSGGIGPLPVNGTRSLPFDCANDNLYYKIRAYNPSHEKDPSGINLQVPRDA
jgi:hypothetical protein